MLLFDGQGSLHVRSKTLYIATLPMHDVPSQGLDRSRLQLGNTTLI